MEGVTRVAVVDLHAASIQKACQTLNEAVPSCNFYGKACDVWDEKAVSDVWAKIAKENGGRVDILVQAAGIGKFYTAEIRLESVYSLAFYSRKAHFNDYFSW
jgi:NAD(P)-dependent dehydrogenase (short-subunit alcohol dehydrogenase family)